MATTIQFAILLKDPVAPTADQLKRVFKTFSHLTDADAVRLAVGARGILMKRLSSDAARALQGALQAEGVGVTILAEGDLPKLPEALSLNRLELWPQSLTIYDPMNRPRAIAWNEVTLLAAGAAQHFEANRTHTELMRFQRNAAVGGRVMPSAEAGSRVESGPQFLLELLVEPGPARYRIEAAEFSFQSVIDRPGLTLEEKFIWLVRELCHHAPRALLNHGARRLQTGQETVAPYLNRQALADEMVWWLWRRARDKQDHAT
jgi:hypothetical protein